MNNNGRRGVRNNVAFPASTMVEFDFPRQEMLPAFKLLWYDGGMKPRTPEELEVDGKELSREGMMFVGDKGKILASFHGNNPVIIPEKRMVELTGSAKGPAAENSDRERAWIESFKKDEESPGTFLKAAPVTQTILLGAVAQRAGRKVVYDPEKVEITNYDRANQYLTREYRSGWEL